MYIHTCTCKLGTCTCMCTKSNVYVHSPLERSYFGVQNVMHCTCTCIHIIQLRMQTDIIGDNYRLQPRSSYTGRD